MNQYLVRISLFALAILGMTQIVCAKDNRFTVIIDAGHGGKDPGAVGRRYQEKAINLSVALKLGNYIKDTHSDVKVIYTRTTDVFVELQQRASIANRNKADLFISIHTNANNNRSAYGTETYTLGLARSEANLGVAKRENSVILLEDNFSTKYEGFDPKSPESYIMFEFLQNKHMEQSINLASSIQNNFKKYSNRNDRGVRQAGFLVLHMTGMPSVLVELGYISNTEEETFLGSDAGQDKLAQSIFRAFTNFKDEWDRKQKQTITRGSTVRSAQVLANERPARDSAREEVEVDTSKKEITKQEKSDIAIKETVNESNLAPNKIVYKIQIATSPEKYTKNSSVFKGLSPVHFYKEKKLYKYTYFETTNRQEANKKLIEVKKKFKDAFVVAFKGSERIL